MLYIILMTRWKLFTYYSETISLPYLCPPLSDNNKINALPSRNHPRGSTIRTRACGISLSRRRHTKRCTRFASRWTNASGSGRGAEEEEGIARRWQNRRLFFAPVSSPSSSSRHRHTVVATSEGNVGGEGGGQQRCVPPGVGGGGTSAEGGENATRHYARRGGASYER